MELSGSTITMERDAAREAYEAYADAVRRRHNNEDADAAIAAGYKALADGKTLISLRGVIAAGGVDEDHRPRLAIAPAPADWVWMARSRDGAVWFSPTSAPRRTNARGRVNLPVGTLPEIDRSDWLGYHYGANHEWHPGIRGGLEPGWNNEFPLKAMVPTVPPQHRPTRALTGYHVLFEAEWTQEPPVDPALLRHLAGDLWVVLATWDLTDLERAVLAERNALAGS